MHIGSIRNQGNGKFCTHYVALETSNKIIHFPVYLLLKTYKIVWISTNLIDVLSEIFSTQNFHYPQTMSSCWFESKTKNFTEEVRENALEFSKVDVKVFWNFFALI